MNINNFLSNALNKLVYEDIKKMKDRNGKDRVYSINGERFNLVGNKDDNGNTRWTRKEVNKGE
jgi:hypothetical protein